jgi:hypothetical protein
MTNEEEDARNMLDITSDPRERFPSGTRVTVNFPPPVEEGRRGAPPKNETPHQLNTPFGRGLDDDAAALERETLKPPANPPNSAR